jgi:hypothetical protein
MEGLDLYILTLVGLFMHHAKKYVEHYNEGRKYSIKGLAPTIILSIVTSLVIVYLRDDIGSLYPITPFSALVIGYFGNSIFFSFIKAKKPQLDES